MFKIYKNVVCMYIRFNHSERHLIFIKLCPYNFYCIHISVLGPKPVNLTAAHDQSTSCCGVGTLKLRSGQVRVNSLHAIVLSTSSGGGGVTL